MAHSLSAIKRHRQSLRRRERNKTRITAARSSVREARELIAAGSQEEAQEAVRSASSVLDRAARRGVLHPNNAARRKSRLLLKYNAAIAAVQVPVEEPRPSKGKTSQARSRRSSGDTPRRKPAKK